MSQNSFGDERQFEQPHEIQQPSTTENKFSNMDNLLILEKAFEQSGQDWIENMNIIEQTLVRVTDRLSQENPYLRSKFIIRRLPTYLAPFTNKNEYGIIIENVHFTLTPPVRGSSRNGSTDRPGISNFGQIEIFYKAPPEIFTTKVADKEKNDVESDLSKEILNENQAHCSHEFFKRFAAAFVSAYQSESEFASSNQEIIISQQQSDEQKSCSSNNVLSSPFHQYSGNVQLVGPHLLLDLQENIQVSKIFTLNQPPLPLPKNLKSKCTVNVNYLKSMITIQYEDTEVIVRPCLYYSKGFSKVNANILERLPLHHFTYLQIGESLTKGLLLFPTSFETLWTLQFWPSESHIISLYHPSSICSRVFKLYAVFCINPHHFWETINTSFLEGGIMNANDDDVDTSIFESLMDNNSKGNLLNADYMLSSFLFELENFCHIEDWAPRNFPTRFMYLLKTAVDSYEKGFHSHYFTKINVLRGIWKNNNDDADSYSDKEETSAVLRELDDITESQENLDDYGEKAYEIMAIDDLEDDFGFQFEDLETIDNEDIIIQSRPTSETIYKNLNPRHPSRDPATPGSTKGRQQELSRRKERPTTLSRMFGSNLVKKFGSKLSRRHSDAISSPRSNLKSQNQTDGDIASGFEESIAQMRRPDSLRLRFKFQTESDLTETTFSELRHQNYNRQSRQFSTTTTTSSHVTVAFQNEGFQNHVETIYSTLLQHLIQLPPSASPNFNNGNNGQQNSAAELDKVKKALESQEELISTWGKACNDLPKPKCICPHIFNPRQIQYLSLVIRTVSKCSPNMIQIVKTSKIPAWEISGDILRTVLHQMRVEVAESESLKEKQRPKKGGLNLRNGSSNKEQQKNKKDRDDGAEGVPIKKKSKSLSMKFSLRKRKSNNYSPCHHDFLRSAQQEVNGASSSDPQFSLEEPEIATSHRLLEWLWNLKCSEIGRLSDKAYHYIEQLFHTSLINSHFLEQFSDDRVYSTMALKSAMAVTRIMADLTFPVSVPLCAATAKGWLWAEMILSLASWNNEKGYTMKTTIPLTMEHLHTASEKNEVEILERVLTTENAAPNLTMLKKKQFCSGGSGSNFNEADSEPDLDAATLAYHSELATPIGWNDFEDPRRPGPLAVAILIFSSTTYYKKWEMAPGNIVQVLVRLQKFNSMQHVGQMLSPPHRKTALNEVRKLNKSLSVRIYNFETGENVMSKTFRRLTSLRATRIRMMRRENATAAAADTSHPRKYYSCKDVGCGRNQTIGTMVVTVFNGQEFECTKL